MEWIDVQKDLPKDQERVLVYVPDNYVPIPGNPSEIEHKPIKIVKFERDFYGPHKKRHKNNQGNHFWTGEGTCNHFFQEVSHWMSLPLHP